MLHPRSLLGPLRQSVADLIAAEADVFEIPVAEMAQRDQRCLALAMRDHGGNPPVDEATEARQKNGGSSSDSRRGHRVRRGIVEHRHGYFLRKGWRSPRFPLCPLRSIKTLRKQRFILQTRLRCSRQSRFFSVQNIATATGMPTLLDA